MVGGSAVAASPEPPLLFLETAGPAPWNGGMGWCPGRSASFPEAVRGLVLHGRRLRDLENGGAGTRKPRRDLREERGSRRGDGAARIPRGGRWGCFRVCCCGREGESWCCRDVRTARRGAQSRFEIGVVVHRRVLRIGVYSGVLTVVVRCSTAVTSVLLGTLVGGGRRVSEE